MMLSRLPYHDSLKLLEADIHHANALYVSFSFFIIILLFTIFYLFIFNQISKLSTKTCSLFKRVIIMFNCFLIVNQV
jgi:hypothetical protein